MYNGLYELWFNFILGLNVAKCNLGKVNLKQRLVSSFPNCAGGGPMPLAGAPRDLYTQLLACLQFFAKCLCFNLVACLPILCCVFPNPPSLFIFCGLGIRVLVGKYSTYQFSVTVPGWGCFFGCHGYLLPNARALPGFINLYKATY